MKLEELQAIETSVASCQSEIDLMRSEMRSIDFKVRSIRVLDAIARASLTARELVMRSIVWRPGGVLIAGTIAFGLGLVAAGTIGAVIFSAAGASVATVMLIYPSDRRLVNDIATRRSQEAALIVERGKILSRFGALCAELESQRVNLEKAKVLHESAMREASDEVRLGKLLAENWRELRSVEFEKYLKRVFIALGDDVETTAVTGDQGVDLIIAHKQKRIAVQVKGYLDSVSNSAVQEAHAGMTYYKCDASAVITNSRFTRSAIDLADKCQCALIDEFKLPDLVMRRIVLWDICEQLKDR